MSNIWFIEQTDRFNPTLNMPLFEYTWTRDIVIDNTVSFGNTSTSFTRNKWFGQGTKSINGRPWMGKVGNTTSTIDTDSDRIIKPVRDLGMVIEMSDREMAMQMQSGNNILQQKMDGLRDFYQFTTDGYVYLGDDEVAPETGLLNNSEVGVGNVADGASGDTEWSTKTADEILIDVNEILTQANINSGNAVYPNKLLLPYEQFNDIATRPRSTYTDITVLQYILKSNISTINGGVPLEIKPCKWNVGVGVGGTNRMVAYNQSEKFVRLPLYPLSPLKDIPLSFGMSRSYQWLYGELEWVYPETALYRDGI